MIKFLSPWLVMGLLSVTSGCGSIAYYAQAINGHAQLLHRTEPIQMLLHDNAEIEPVLRARLETVLKMRAFASEQLGLPDNGSYRTYSDLDRKAVVWSVVATPEFSVAPVQWCYPIIGCASYRGYFSQPDANQEAERQTEKGRDVAVNPVAAYSTLGWFDDPLPSSVIHWPEPMLAGLLFHELAHQQLYVEDDSAFNESFATAVERAGIQRWLAKNGSAKMRADWEKKHHREALFIKLLQQTRRRLKVLYGKPLPVSDLRREKREEWQRLRDAYRRLSEPWQDGAGYDAWFERPLNNARFALVNTYEQWVPAFMALLHRENGDLRAFYAASQRLSELPKIQRDQRLMSFMPEVSVRPLP